MSAPALPIVDSTAALKLILELLAIPGKSRQELGVLTRIRSLLQDFGVPASCVTSDDAHQHSPGEAGNLIVKLPGTRKGPRRLLMAHVDTVPLCVGCEPYVDGQVIRSKNPATALGGDDRAGVAVVLNTVRELLARQLPHPPLTLLFVVQEEIGLCGARYCSLNKLGNPTAGFNWDGDNPAEVCIGATGDYAIEIEIDGIASHAGVHPELGVSATAIASLAIADLVQNGWHGLIEKGKKRGTSNVGVIQAGEATNVVTPKLSLRAEARSHDPVFRKKIVAAYEKAFKAAVKHVKTAKGKRGSLSFHADLKYEAFQLPKDCPPVLLAQEAITSLGMTPVFDIANGGLDANWMTAHGIPTVTLGCGQHAIHTVNEYLDIDEFLRGCELGVRIAVS